MNQSLTIGKYSLFTVSFLSVFSALSKNFLTPQHNVSQYNLNFFPHRSHCFWASLDPNYDLVIVSRLRRQIEVSITILTTTRTQKIFTQTDAVDNNEPQLKRKMWIFSAYSFRFSSTLCWLSRPLITSFWDSQCMRHFATHAHWQVRRQHWRVIIVRGLITKLSCHAFVTSEYKFTVI